MGVKKSSGYFKGLTRKEYIEAATKLSNEIGVENLTIRNLADHLGCSSAALYRYFKDKDELTYFVNLQLLERYMIRLNKAQKNWSTVWDKYSGVWDCYCREAFSNPYEFDQLFFKNPNTKLNTLMKEFFEMFPDNIQSSNEIFQEMLTTADFLGRDYRMCLKCVDAGAISLSKANQLNRSVCMIFKGYFKTVQDEGIEKYGIDSWTRQCIDDIDMIVFALADDLQGYKGYYVNNQPSQL